LARSSRFSSTIEPEVSTTSSTFAGLRSSRHASFTRESTRGSGRPSTRRGCLGSAPAAAEIDAAGFSFRSAGRKPNSPAFSASISSSRNLANCCAPSRCWAFTHGALSTMNGLSE
jgi:hypothetical protein